MYEKYAKIVVLKNTCLQIMTRIKGIDGKTCSYILEDQL